MHFHQLAFFRQFDEVAAYGVLRHFDHPAEIAYQHLVVQVYFMKDQFLAFSLKHAFVRLVAKFALFFTKSCKKLQEKFTKLQDIAR